MLKKNITVHLFLYGATVLTGLGPPHYRGYTITLVTTPLDKWSARRTNLYLTTHNTQERHPCPRRDSKPESQQASCGKTTARPLKQAHNSPNHTQLTSVFLQTYRHGNYMKFTWHEQEDFWRKADIRTEDSFTFLRAIMSKPRWYRLSRNEWYYQEFCCY